MNLATSLLAAGKPAEALPLLEESLRELGAAERDGLPGSVVHNELGCACQSLSRLADAAAHFNRAAEILEARYPGETRRLAMVLQNQATLWHARGDYHRSESLYRRVLKMAGDGDPVTLKTLESLAMLYLDQGRHERAERCLRRVLERQENSPGVVPRRRAATLHNLAAVYQARRSFAAAESTYRRALNIWDSLDPAAPERGNTLGGLGTIAYWKRDFDEAGRLLEAALAIEEAAYGAGHLKVAARLQSLAEVYAAQDRWEEARSCCERAITAWETTAGPHHPRLVAVLHTYVRVLRASGSEDQAREVEAREQALRKAVARANPASHVVDVDELAAGK